MIRAAALRQAAAMATTGHSFHPIRLGSWYSSRAAAIPTRSGLGARCCPWEDTTNYNSNSNTSASSFGGGRRLGGGSGTTATRHFRRERKTFLKKKLTKAAAMDDDDDSHTESDTTTTTASSSSSSSSTTNNNDNNTTTKSVVASTWTSFGENAPRLPHLLAIPLVSRPLFPGLVTSLTLTDPATIDALDHHWYNRTNYNSSSSSSSSTTTTTPTAAYISCFLRSQHSSGVSEGGVLLSTPEVIQDPSDLYKTGTFAQIKSFTRGVTANPKPVDLNSSTSRNNNSNRHRHRSMDGSSDDEDEENATSSSSSSKNNNSAATLILLAHRRVDLVSVDDIGPPIDVTVSHWPRVEYITNDSIRALSNEIISIIREIAQMNVLFRENLQLYPMRFDANDPFRLADFAASITASGTPEDLQAVLEERDPEQRLHKALLLLNREREVSKLQMEISAKVEKKLTEAQRKYFLTEQLKSIKKELGMERDDKDALLQKFRQQLSEYPDVPAEIMETIESELEKFASLEKNSAEFNVTRGYLDWLVGVPWGVVTDENFDIGQARITLDRDHYGLDDVKSTILQFIAIGKLKGSVQGRILCLVGPPGTGTLHGFIVFIAFLRYRDFSQPYSLEINCRKNLYRPVCCRFFGEKVLSI